jgi:ABC-2 type transport system permease protein
MTKVIFFRELKSLFQSPLAYVIAGLFCLLTGWIFFNLLINYVENVQNLPGQVQGQWGFINGVLLKLFGNMNFLFIFIVPILTMGSFAKEKNDETINLYWASTATDWNLILGKFFSLVIYICSLLIISLLFIYILSTTGLREMSLVWSAYIGILFNSVCYIALGLFISSTTKNQIIAAMCTFVLILGIWFLSWASQITNNYIIMQVLKHLSIVFHFEQFAKGLISFSSLTYYASFIGFSLFLTKKTLESRDW